MTGRGVLDKMSSILMALVVALIVWLLAVEEQHPMRTVEPYPALGEAGLPIVPRGQPEGRAVYDLSSRSARLRLRGKEVSVRAVEPDDFEVVADVSGVSADARAAVVPVVVHCGACARQGLRVLDWTPREVSLKLGDVVTSTRRVIVVAAEASPDGFTRGFEITPAEVVLQGARAAVSRVFEVVAPLDDVPAGPSTPAAMALSSVPVVALDADRQPVVDVAAAPAEVAVSVVLRRRDVEVAVDAVIVGADGVASGYYFNGLAVDPTFVQLQGPSDLLQPLRDAGSVPTVPLDVSGQSGVVQELVALELPRGVTAVNAPTGVTVTAKIDPLPGTVQHEVPIELEGMRPGMELASVTPERVKVLISGPRPLVEGLQPTDIRAVLDLTGLGVGPHRLRPSLRLPAELQQRSVTPEEVEVVLRAAGTATPQPTARGPR